MQVIYSIYKCPHNRQSSHINVLIILTISVIIFWFIGKATLIVTAFRKIN